LQKEDIIILRCRKHKTKPGAAFERSFLFHSLTACIVLTFDLLANKLLTAYLT
jgi:hypothetical protein